MLLNYTSRYHFKYIDSGGVWRNNIGHASVENPASCINLLTVDGTANWPVLAMKNQTTDAVLVAKNFITHLDIFILSWKPEDEVVKNN